jgi:cysteine synthase A
MLSAARSHPNFREKMPIIEGTSGSTGISLAFQCNALGLPLTVVMPDDQSPDKTTLLEQLGATVIRVPSCSISNPQHYVNTARRIAEERKGIFMDQFENSQNFVSHFETTAPEIWQAMDGRLDAFVMSAGTGGTIAGVSRLIILVIVLLYYYLTVV